MSRGMTGLLAVTCHSLLPVCRDACHWFNRNDPPHYLPYVAAYARLMSVNHSLSLPLVEVPIN